MTGRTVHSVDGGYLLGTVVIDQDVVDDIIDDYGVFIHDEPRVIVFWQDGLLASVPVSQAMDPTECMCRTCESLREGAES